MFIFWNLLVPQNLIIHWRIDTSFIGFSPLFISYKQRLINIKQFKWMHWHTIPFLYTHSFLPFCDHHKATCRWYCIHQKKPHKAHKRWFSRNKNGIFSIFTRNSPRISSLFSVISLFVIKKCGNNNNNENCVHVFDIRGKNRTFYRYDANCKDWIVIKGELNVFIHKNQIFMCPVNSRH